MASLPGLPAARSTLRSAAFETGATRTLLGPETVQSENLPTQVSPTVSIMFCEGNVVHSNVVTSIGLSSAQVVEELVDDLISPNDYVDNGSFIYLDNAGGYIGNPLDEQRVPIHRINGSWRVWLSDLKDYSLPGVTARSADVVDIGVPSMRSSVAWRPTLSAARVCAQPKGVAVAATDPPEEVSGDDDEGRVQGELGEVSTSTSAPSGRFRELGKDGILQRFVRLHEIMGHAEPRAMAKAVSGDDPTWRNSSITAKQILRCSKLYVCPHCILSKRNALPLPVNIRSEFDNEEGAELTSKNARPGEIISMDPVGPITPASSEGYDYFYLFKDVASGFNTVLCASSKNSDHILQAVKYVFDFYKKHGWTVRILRTDAEKEFLSSTVDEFLSAQNVTLQTSVPYAHWQNAVERDVQTVVKGTSTLLHAQPWLPANCWDLALFPFVDVHNRTPNKRSTVSPHQLVTKGHTDFRTSYGFAFGDIVSVVIPDNQRTWKFDMKTDLGIYVGQPSTYKRGCLIYWPSTRTTSVRLDCVRLEITDTQFLHYYQRRYLLNSNTPPLREVLNAVHDFNNKEVHLNPEEFIDKSALIQQPFSAPLFDQDDIVPKRRVTRSMTHANASS